MNMTSRDSTQVRPAETDGWEQGKEKKEKYTLDFFEVLEDRYAYEGFNKFMFYLVFFFIIYNLHLSQFYYDDVAGEKLLLRRIPNDA